MMNYKKNKLLITFCKGHQINTTIENIQQIYQLASNKIFLLENMTQQREYILSYNILIENVVYDKLLPNTILAQRKKETNTIYTINALNYIVAVQNNGICDSNFIVDWENYRNSILLFDNNELVTINTKLEKIITV